MEDLATLENQILRLTPDGPPPSPQFWGDMNFRSLQNWGLGAVRQGLYFHAQPLWN